MAILNDDFDFNKHATANDKQAFRHPPRRELLILGTKLYRFVTPTNNEVLVGRWWYPKATYDKVLHLANVTGCSIPDTARSRLAVTIEWNPAMNWLCIIMLTKSVYAWCGPVQYQPLTEQDRKVLLPGNFDQIYLPNLAGGTNGMSSRVAMVEYFGEINR
ncbi:MAG: hypothetical protein M3R15_30905 [Acidobacteriota bacterium]|nr:hypothetical protein [Acidobacteriota bacterium]